MPAVADERSRQAAEVAHARLLEQRAEETQAAYAAADDEVSALTQQVAELERKSSAGAPLAEKVKNLQKNSKAASRAWTAHCDNYNGVRDPYKHDLASLRLFFEDPY